MPEGSHSISSAFTSLIPIAMIIVIFYFLILRPQQKKLQDHKDMLASIKQGDKIITSGGIIGTVSKIVQNESIIMIEIANNVVVKISKETIVNIFDAQKT